MGRPRNEPTEQAKEFARKREEQIKIKVLDIVNKRTKGIINLQLFPIRWGIPIDNGWSYDQTANWIIESVVTSLQTSVADSLAPEYASPKSLPNTHLRSS
jgi:hypothetical protein